MKPLLFALACAAALPIGAAPLGYVTQNNTLYSIDFATANLTQIGPMGLTSGNMQALALSPNGTLYGTDGVGFLWQVNTSTGHATSIGSTGQGNIAGLDFNGNELLGISWDFFPTVFSINTNTAQVTTVVTSLSQAIQFPPAIAIESGNTALVVGGGAQPSLYALDLTTGQVTLRGALPGYSDAIDFAADGNLYGVVTTFPTAQGVGTLYQIDPTNGSGKVVGSTGAGYILGMAAGLDSPTRGVPEPGTMGLLAAGLAIVAFGARKLKK